MSSGAANSAQLLLMSANKKHPHGLANGSDRSVATTCSTTPSLWSPFPEARIRPSFKRPRRSMIFTSARLTYEFPMGNIQMLGKSKGPMFREDGRSRAWLHARADGAARGGFLAHGRRPADAAQPRHRGFAGWQIQLHYEFTNVEPIKRLRQNCSPCSSTWTCTRISSRTIST